jgi:hypothetical protein
MTERVAPPMLFAWDGECMVPVGRYAQEADRYFVVGQRYRLAEHFERSQKSHNHMFAEVHEVWQNLPEHLVPLFPNEDALRKHALCRAGFCDVDTIVAPSKAFAVELLQKLRHKYDYATINDKVVTLMTAHSQKRMAANGKLFQAQKSAILEILAEMIGVTAQELADNTARAA